MLVVVSKIKKLIKSNAGFNTSQLALDELSREIEKNIIPEACKLAEKDHRRTVMERDIIEVFKNMRNERF